nr:coat protein [Prunus virus I]
MITSTTNPDLPSNAMSTSRGKNNNGKYPIHFDELDALAHNCNCVGGSVSNRQRRNARRAAMFRNAQAKPVVVGPVYNQVSRPVPKASFRLPNNQVWVTRKAGEWAEKSTDTNDAITLRTIMEGIPEIGEDTRVFRILIGFVAKSDGTFGMVDGVTTDVVPDPPIVGRLGFQKNTYRSRDFHLGGKLSTQVASKAIVWCLDDKRREAKRVSLANYWLAISRPAPLLPPEDFLVEGSN